MSRRVDISRVEGFLLELDDRSLNKMLFLLRRLEKGPVAVLAAPHGEKIERDLFALRVKSRSNPRIFYTVNNGEVVALLGVYKKNRKIPVRLLRQCRAMIRDL